MMGLVRPPLPPSSTTNNICPTLTFLSPPSQSHLFVGIFHPELQGLPDGGVVVPAVGLRLQKACLLQVVEREHVFVPVRLVKGEKDIQLSCEDNNVVLVNIAVQFHFEMYFGPFRAVLDRHSYR